MPLLSNLAFLRVLMTVASVTLITVAMLSAVVMADHDAAR